MKFSFIYKITCQPFNPELITGVLWNFNLLGLIEEENQIKIFVTEDSEISEEMIKAKLNNMKKEKLIESFNIHKELLENKNWNELWEKSREVIRISEKIIIKPSFKDYTSKEGEIVITIDPKMSFGTGEHQTTKLVLKLMERYIQHGMKVLDVGSGTGILSIAAVKLGASSAIAIDTDEVCYENCRENCELNGESNSVKILTTEIQNIPEKDFDLIVANIQNNVLLDISGKIRKRLKENKKVILSGLLEQNYDEIVNHYTISGFTLVEKKIMDEWIALVFQLSNSN
jgi:ribosomal protein L11 methyltransferase